MKCERFMDWCQKVGIYAPKLQYPSFFEGGLVGARVLKPIAHREAFLYVPYSAIISLDKCFSDTLLGPVFSENLSVFSEQCNDWE